MPDTERIETLKQAIRDAFEAVPFPYPGDEALALPSKGKYREKIFQHLSGRHWRDALAQVADWLEERAIFALTPEARRFYMPAYLLASLGGYEESAYVCRWVLYALEPPDWMARFRREYDAYTPAQRGAVCRFLELFRDHSRNDEERYTARRALERYWDSEAPGMLVRTAAAAEMPRKERVKQALREAFADMPYPGDRQIAYNPDICDGDELDLDFRGYHWRELPRGLVVYHRDDLVFLSERGLQFYLPAYLLVAVDGDMDLIDWIMYRLTELGNVDELKRKHDSYSRAQRSAVRLFLEYVRDEVPERDFAYETRMALDLYWANDAPGQPRPPIDPARKERVRQAILDAFVDVPYPGDDAIASKSDSSGERMSQALRGIHFRDVPCEVLMNNHAFVYFTAEGVHFYLPAYLIAALDEIGPIIHKVVEWLESRSERPESPHNEVRLFSPAQKHAIRLFLEYVRDTMPHISLGGFVQKALDQYWGR
jgi:hypothetical protein